MSSESAYLALVILFVVTVAYIAGRAIEVRLVDAAERQAVDE